MNTILILEDDTDLANEWRSWLEAEQHRIIHETTVVGAKKVFESREIDLVVCDVFIGKHSSGFSSEGGLSMLSHIMLHVDPKPKSLLITGANSSLAIDRHAQLLKADQFAEKPISKSKFMDIVHKLLAERNDAGPDQPINDGSQWL